MKFAVLLVLVLTTPVYADSITDQGLSLIEKGRAFLRGGDAVILREAWDKGDANSYNIILDRANHDNAMAENLMGVIFDQGKFGQKPRPEKALDWFNKAGMSGNIVALYNLGIIYSNGRIPKGRASTSKAALAFKKVYDSKKGKAIPQAKIWLATYDYINKDYTDAWRICSESNVGPWAFYTNYVMGVMLFEGTSPEGKNVSRATSTLWSALTANYKEAARALKEIYKADGNAGMVLQMDMILSHSMNVMPPVGMSETDVAAAKNGARVFVINNSRPVLLDFSSTLTGFEKWLP